MVGFLYNLKESQGDSQDSTYDIPSMRNMKSGEPAMETTKNSGIIPTVVPTRKSSAQTKWNLPKLYNLNRLKEVNFVLGNSEIIDGSGWALWYLISSPSLCLVTVLSISCNVVFWAPFRY